MRCECLEVAQRAQNERAGKPICKLQHRAVVAKVGILFADAGHCPRYRENQVPDLVNLAQHHVNQHRFKLPAQVYATGRQIESQALRLLEKKVHLLRRRRRAVPAALDGELLGEACKVGEQREAADQLNERGRLVNGDLDAVVEQGSRDLVKVVAGGGEVAESREACSVLSQVLVGGSGEAIVVWHCRSRSHIANLISTGIERRDGGSAMVVSWLWPGIESS